MDRGDYCILSSCCFQTSIQHLYCKYLDLENWIPLVYKQISLFCTFWNWSVKYWQVWRFCEHRLFITYDCSRLFSLHCLCINMQIVKSKIIYIASHWNSMWCRLQPGQVIFRYYYYFNRLYKSEGKYLIFSVWDIENVILYHASHSSIWSFKNGVVLKFHR